MKKRTWPGFQGEGQSSFPELAGPIFSNGKSSGRDLPGQAVKNSACWSIENLSAILYSEWDLGIGMLLGVGGAARRRKSAFVKVQNYPGFSGNTFGKTLPFG